MQNEREYLHQLIDNSRDEYIQYIIGLLEQRGKFIDEKVLFSDEFEPSGKARLENRNITLWERVRRNSEYTKLCNDIKFTGGGFVSNTWMKDNEKLFLKKQDIIERDFGLSLILDPSKSHKEYASNVINEIAPRYTMAALAFRDANQMYENAEDYESRFIEDDSYLTLKVDITKKDQDIISLLKGYLGHFRQYITVEGGRDRFKEEEKYYDVWDLRKRRISFPEIGRQLKKPVDTVKKQFYTAYELIEGKTYNIELFNQLRIEKSELLKTCETCEIRDECTELCPDVAYLVNQDHNKQDWQANRYDDEGLDEAHGRQFRVKRGYKPALS